MQGGAELALAIAARRDALARCALPLALAEADLPAAPQAPAHPDYGRLGKPLADYIHATGALGQPDAEYLQARKLLVPAAELNAFLQAASAKPASPLTAWRSLGERGLWLALQHPRFRRQAAVLDDTAPPRDPPARLGWLNFNLGFRQNRVRPLVESVPLDAGVRTSLLELVAEDRLEQGLGPDRLAEVIWNKSPPSAGEQGRILRLAAHPDWPATHERLREAAELAEQGSQPTEALRAAADLALATGDADLAGHLLERAVDDVDPLLNRHPALVPLCKLLPAPAFAALLNRVPHAEHYARGWRDPFVLELAFASPHAFDELTSLELVDRLFGPLGAPGAEPFSRWAGKLSPAVLGSFETGGRHASAQLQALTLALLARQRLDAAFPPAVLP